MKLDGFSVGHRRAHSSRFFESWWAGRPAGSNGRHAMSMSDPSQIAEALHGRKSGAGWVARCPAHDDHNPSMRVTPAKGLFHCMSCGAAGNAIQFVAKKENLTVKEAALRLMGNMPGVQRVERTRK